VKIEETATCSAEVAEVTARLFWRKGKTRRDGAESASLASLSRENTVSG